MSSPAEELWEDYDPRMWDESIEAPEPASFPNSAGEPSRTPIGKLQAADGNSSTHWQGEHQGTIDPNWISIDDIRQWMYTCDIEHGVVCRPGTSAVDGDHLQRSVKQLATGRPIWLIDVASECIAPFKMHRYIALSYVWGNALSTETTKENIESLQKPGALSEVNTDIIVPRTIRHAMKLVAVLGERYLWVDRFCICQDDAETKHSQLQRMGDIYEQAYLTIVAANGWDANHGLRGIKGVAERRQLSPHSWSDSYTEQIDRRNTVWVRTHIKSWRYNSTH
jgi:hypothetical protein